MKQLLNFMVFLVLAVFAVAWPVNIAYLFWLGFTDSFISDKFFHWEFVSLALVLPWLGSAATLSVYGFRLLWERKAQEK